MRVLPPGAEILDFGAGSCDKTAVLQELGYRCSAFDDLQDPWHLENGNSERIITFAADMGIDFRLADEGDLPWAPESFDMVMAHAVLEHFHDSPRELLLALLALLRPGGYLLVTVPNAVNLRKRVDVLRGRTNLPPFDDFWAAPRWRGHVREYVADDLKRLAEHLGVSIVELRGYHEMLFKLPRWLIPAYRVITTSLPGTRDSWLMLARKPPLGHSHDESMSRERSQSARSGSRRGRARTSGWRSSHCVGGGWRKLRGCAKP